MELPINVIVVLFVAVVVGGIIIGFSQQNISTAQQNLNERFLNQGGSEDDIIRVEAATDTTIISLGEECLARKHGKVPDIDVCFAVFAGSFPDFTTLNGRPLSNGYVINTSITGTVTAVQLLYDPRGWVEVTP